MHCKNKCWFSANKTYCSPCDRKKREQILLESLSGNKAEELLKILKDRSYKELIEKDHTLDNILRRIHILNKNLLYSYLNNLNTTEESHLISRIYTHSNTNLCPVVGWMIRENIFDYSINIGCLTCMAHLINSKEKDTIKYSIHFNLYGPHHINIHAAVSKNKKNMNLLLNMASAIIEDSFLLAQYNDIVRKNIDNYDSYKQSLAHHPLLHKKILESGDIDSKKNLYKYFRQRKEPFWEELMAKTMHPSRVVQWCMTEDEKEDFSEITYVFSPREAPWNINFC